MSKSSEPLARLFNDGKQLLYNRGDTILRAGDVPSGVYLITAGWVKVYSLCHDGEPNIIMSLGPDEIFPLVWAFTEHMRDVSFAALDTTTVLRVSKETFLKKMSQDGDIANTVSCGLARHFLRLEDELNNLHYRTARERVAYRLLSLADRFGQHRANRVILNIRVPNEYIARSSNMTRETASREISRLARRGIVRNVKGFLVIMDIDGLKSECGAALYKHSDPSDIKVAQLPGS